MYGFQGLILKASFPEVARYARILKYDCKK